LKIKPSAEAYANRGVAYQQTNRDELALADYEQAIKLNSNFGRVYLLRGLISLKRGEGETAQKDFDRAFQLDPGLHAEFDPMIQQLRPRP
jgi:tetratricopeptide (TPR) repeat protein